MGNSILRRGIAYLQQRNKMFLYLCFKGFFSLHTVLFWHFCVGRYHYPRRAFHAAKTLDARRSRWLICRFYAAAVFALCGLNILSAGTHATPAPNRAHSGLHAETRGVFTA